ncbi:hypothetical protein [Variovorax sp. J31P207]|uniref:hypothetical protein n=1 Tax=Variovorax sp. J31P207 TaxID=3053510 RepID=UPI0025765F3C|nr:hypothetical protein [Variovorax sp. J31P207]MDM0067669.1 hypothetical protein [Variovorax sp. J31P207]
MFGAKLWLIRVYANGTPYWDQWDAEARLFERLLNGDWAWDRWLSAHNEHRILTTRMLAVALLYLNQLWSPLMEMVVNAGLHVLALATLVWLLGKATGRTGISAMLLFTLTIFAVPYAWENTITGFQGQFYFLLLFSVLSIWWLVTAAPLSNPWWGGVAMAVIAYFSFASGAFAPAAALATVAARCCLVTHRGRREWVALLLLLALFAACVLSVPRVAEHGALRAANVQQFARAANAALAWPAMHHTGPAALVRNLPWILLTVSVFRQRAAANDPRWFLVAMGVWLAGQTVAIAFGRASDVMVSRYLDLHSIGLLINFAALLTLMAGMKTRARVGAVLMAACWLAFFVNALMAQMDTILANAAGKRAGAVKQEVNLVRYLRTDDETAAKALPFFELPYYDAGGLIRILESPVVRSFLPMNLQTPLVPVAVEHAGGQAFTRGGVYPGTLDCGCVALGSYGSAGDAQIGEVAVHYGARPNAGQRETMQVKVAGYPSRAGRLEVVQDGVVKPLRLREDPGEKWAALYFEVKPGPFALRAVDSSPSSWMAVGDPVRSGRFDALIDRLLALAERFLALGAVLACLALICASSTTSRESPDQTT